VDRVPVPGRRVVDHDGEQGRLWRKSEGKERLMEGHIVFELLEGLLQRDPANRMTLDKLKVNLSLLPHLNHKLILSMQSSQFILTSVPEPEAWLCLTSPTARISVDSHDTSQAMSPLRFRAGWGTRLVRQFSSLWSKGGNTIVSSPPSPRRKTSGALSIATQVPHLIMSVATPKASPTTVTTSTATSTLQRRRSGVGRRGTLSGAIGRRLADGVSDGKAPKFLPLDGFFDDEIPILSTQHPTNEMTRPRHPHSSPTEPKSMRWWKRSVAGILSWSPDRYDLQLAVEKPESRDGRVKEEKERKQLSKKGSKTMRVESAKNLVRELAWLSDPELVLDVEHDPMLTSRTFDSYTATSAELQLPWSARNHDADMTQGLSMPQNENHSLTHNTGVPPPVSRHSEEAFRTYLPSPESAEDAKFFTTARRASSWGQGDKAEYEVQSITSDLALSDAFEVSQHVMWRGAEGLYVMDQGVLVAVSTSVDEGDRVSSGDIVPAGGINSPNNNAGPGPSTARYRASQAAASLAVQRKNLRRLTPILDDHGHNHDRDHPLYEFGDDHSAAVSLEADPGEGDHSADESRENWSEEEDPYDDDDASSDDHALTFSPSNKRVAQYGDYND